MKPMKLFSAEPTNGKGRRYSRLDTAVEYVKSHEEGVVINRITGRKAAHIYADGTIEVSLYHAFGNAISETWIPYEVWLERVGKD